MSITDLKKGLIASLIIHLLLFGIAMVRMPNTSEPPKGDSEASSQDQANSGKEPSQPTEVDIVPPPKDKKAEKDEESAEDGILARAPHAADECQYYFGGIGVSEALVSTVDGDRVMVVTEVHAGYPAYKAGMQVGDVLLNHGQIRGEIGTDVTVVVVRDGETLRFSIVRDKICTDRPMAAKHVDPTREGK